VIVVLIAHVPHGQTLLYNGGALVCSTSAASAEGQTMRDILRRYRAIRHALTQGDPTPPQGHGARPLHPRAALMSRPRAWRRPPQRLLGEAQAPQDRRHRAFKDADWHPA